jgi:diguanylate cyclase (GGDEF)-like protein
MDLSGADLGRGTGTSTLTTRVVLRLVAQRRGEDSVDHLLRSIGMDDRRTLLESRHGRVAYADKIEVFAAAARVLDDPRFGLHLAGLVIDDPEFALLRQLVRAAGSPGRVFQHVSRVSARFDSAAVFRCVRVGRTSAVLAWRVLAPNDPHRVDCDYNLGMLQRMPILFGLPPATVLHPVCQIDGAPECLYDIRWTPRPARAAMSWARSRRQGSVGSFVDTGQYEAKIAALEAAANDVVAGGPVEDSLARIGARADSALHAAGHLLAVTLPRGDRHVHHVGVGAALVAAVDDLEASDPGLRTVAGHPVVVTPVVSSTRRYGVLAVVAVPGREFSLDDVATLDAYGRHVAATLEMTTLLARAGEEARTATMLLDVARSLSQHRTVAALAEAVAAAVLPLSGARRSSFALLDPDTRVLTIAGSSGWPRELVAEAERYTTDPTRSPELYDLVRSPQPVLIDAGRSAWARATLAELGVRAMVAAPVVHQGDPLGILLAHWVDGAPDRMTEVLSARLSGLAGLAAVALDNTRLLERVRRQALHDALTDLPNRLLLEDRLDQALSAARRTGAPVGLLFCDVNRFKRVNDTLGHAAGDELLRRLADALRASVRDGDTVARLSGDEFIVLLPLVQDSATLREVTARIRSRLAEPLLVAGEEIHVNMAIGDALSDGWVPGSAPPRTIAAGELIARADREMYQLKARTRGLPTPTPNGVDRLRLETDLRGASGRGELVVHYQPQTDVRTGQVVAVEALVRWHHPDLGLVAPSVFIPIAEDSGAIDELGAHVLQEACRTVVGWRIAGRPLEVAVNVSASQLHADGFVDLVRGVLVETGLTADRLVLEVTESQVVSDAASGTHLRSLRDLGVGISIDDFGTGYSSLAQLRRMPVTELKIDRSFTAELPGSRAFVAGIVGLAHGLGLRVVAEGIEQADQLQALVAAGCDRAQGYLLGRPGPRASWS